MLVRDPGVVPVRDLVYWVIGTVQPAGYLPGNPGTVVGIIASARRDNGLYPRPLIARTSAELAGLTQTLARRIGRFLERQGLLERDAENSYLAGDDLEAGPMEQLLGSSITYRIAVGPQQGHKVFTLQTLPACDESFDGGVGKVAGFSLHAGVAARPSLGRVRGRDADLHTDG